MAQPPPIIALPRVLYLTRLSDLIPTKSNPRLASKMTASRPQGPIHRHQDVTCCHWFAVKSATPTTRITTASLGSQLVPTISSKDREGFLGTGLATLAAAATLGAAVLAGTGGGAVGRGGGVGAAGAGVIGCTGGGRGTAGAAAGLLSGCVVRKPASAVLGSIAGGGGGAAGGWAAGFKTSTGVPQRIQNCAAGASPAPHLEQTGWTGPDAAATCGTWVGTGDGGAGEATGGAGFSAGAGFGATKDAYGGGAACEAAGCGVAAGWGRTWTPGWGDEASLGGSANWRLRRRCSRNSRFFTTCLNFSSVAAASRRRRPSITRA